MKPKASKLRSAGFTMVEIMIGVAILSAVGGLGYSMLMSSTTLLAKNLSINSSNIITRSSLDRIYSEMNQANRLPTLINADGTTVTGSGPAAGIIFDRYLGGPYIVGNPAGGGLAASATTFKLFYSTNSMAQPPVPAKNDVVIMDGSTRALVSSCSAPQAFSGPTPTPAPNPGEMRTVTLQNTLSTYTIPAGTGIPWSVATQQTAYLVHRKAFVVVPVNGTAGPAELRMYPDAETVTDYNDASKFVVISRSIGTSTVGGFKENTPFSLVTQNGATFVNIAMRVEDQQFNRRLASKQANDLNTFLRVDTMSRPRNIQ